MSAIHGVNVGGNLFDVTDSSNVAPIQLTNFASRAYAKDRAFIMADGLLYRATVAIASGDPIVVNGNCKRTTLDEILSVIETDSDLIAPTEDGATSSADYVIGEQIVRSGILYKVIDDITTGDAFAIDSNIQVAGTLTEQIKAINNTLVLKANAADVPTKAQISNPNLLDNPWFTVNQRGQSSYSNAQWKYTIDRYMARTNDAFSITDNGLKADTSNGFSLLQRIEKARFSGKGNENFTLSILLSTGEIFSASGTPTNGISFSNERVQISLYNYGGAGEWVGISLYVYNNTDVIRAVKLELGSVSTLAMDTVPNYATELLKCQRYFIRFKSGVTYSIYSDMGYVVSATEVRTPMNLPVSMRQSPTVTAFGSFRIFNATDYSTMSQSITSVSGEGFLGSKLMLKCVGTGFISGKMAMLSADNDANTYIDFSADL